MTVAGTSTITVHLVLFAAYADLAGRDELDLPLDAPATVADVLDAFRRAWPGATRLPPRPLVAVNQSHAAMDTPVKHGDEVALLPPLAGG